MASLAWSGLAWSWWSEWSGCFLVELSALAVLRAERVGAGAAVAETRSGGGQCQVEQVVQDPGQSLALGLDGGD
ncbi:hypothetical protein ACFVOJ_31410, partial [Streptomyces sp. NPDC057781]|uniref:hypothetical protein n=1 Tax=Streptomyces sp. NPDC057781 TaxID=3346248 RepID=UPI0036CBF8FD